MSAESRTTRGPLDLTIGLSQTEPKKFADAVAASIECYGCALISDHGVDQTIIDRVLSQYAPPTNEQVDSNSGRISQIVREARALDTKSPDPSLIWQAKRDFIKQIDGNGDWLECPASFRGPVSELYTELSSFGSRMLAAVAQFLWLSNNWFEEPMCNNNDVMQLIGVPANKIPNSPLLPETSDPDIISLILTRDELDLEFQHRWHDEIRQHVTLKNGDMLVITGKMLQRVTNDILKPPSCRIISTRGPTLLDSFLRFSLPFHDEFMIRSIAECVDWKSYPDRYPVPIAARDLQQMITPNQNSPK